MSVPRRVREQRSIYARVPDQNFRLHSPDGFLTDYLPLPTPGHSSDIDAGFAGQWWQAEGNEPYSKTTGSPLTERANRAQQKLQGAAVLPAITRCLTILVDSVVRTRWTYKDGKGNVIPRPLFVHDPMLLSGAPGPIFPLAPYGQRLTGQGFYSSLLADAILWGQGAFVYIEAADRTPLPGSLMMLNPFMFRTAEDGHIVLDPWGENPLRTDFDGRFQLNGETWRVAVMFGAYPNHGPFPQGVLLRHWKTFQVGARIQNYIGDQFTTGIPSGYLSVSTPNFGVMVDDPDNPGEEVAEQDLLKRKWMQAHGRGRRSVAVLNSTVTYTPISINPIDADAVKIASVSRVDIAHAFGMSSVWLDEGMSGLNYSNSSERRADLVSMTAGGWGEKLTNVISSLLPYGSECSVNWATFVAPSVEALMPPLVAAVQNGIMTAYEARQYLGFEPWTGPDPKFTDHSKAANDNPVPAQLQAFVQGSDSEGDSNGDSAPNAQ